MSIVCVRLEPELLYAVMDGSSRMYDGSEDQCRTYVSVRAAGVSHEAAVVVANVTKNFIVIGKSSTL